MSRTADVFHEEMSLSKEVAYSNMATMVVTADVTHDPMSGLHVRLPVVEPPPLLTHHNEVLNRQLMSVMLLTSQSAMLPYVARAAVSLLHHRSVAFCRSRLSAKVVCADALVGGSSAPKKNRGCASLSAEVERWGAGVTVSGCGHRVALSNAAEMRACGNFARRGLRS